MTASQIRSYLESAAGEIAYAEVEGCCGNHSPHVPENFEVPYGMSKPAAEALLQECTADNVYDDEACMRDIMGDYCYPMDNETVDALMELADTKYPDAVSRAAMKLLEDWTS